MTFRNRGPVTVANSIFNVEAGTVSCPLSTNKWTDDEYFTIDIDKFSLVVGLCWRTIPQRVNGDTVCRVITTVRKGTFPFPGKSGSRTEDQYYLHRLIFNDELGDGIVVDHVLHWTDNRRSSVEFVSAAENIRRGAALFHRGKRNRRKKVA